MVTPAHRQSLVFPLFYFLKGERVGCAIPFQSWPFFLFHKRKFTFICDGALFHDEQVKQIICLFF